MIDDPAPPGPAAERWAEGLAGWGLPAHIVEQAPVSPWSHDVARFASDHTSDHMRARDTTSTVWAREVLPPRGGTVLDVGCGGGRASLALVPPAAELVGVDRSDAMLDAFVAAAMRAGVARRTVAGSWPAVAPDTPVADVVVCHHVVYDVGDVAPFLWSLTDHARLAVVVELPVRHPMSAWAPAFEHFWGLTRPAGPFAGDLVAVVRELGFDPEHAVGPRAPLSPHSADPATLLPTARRRLCLPPERDDELAAWLAEHPPPFVDTVLTVRWPGAAEPVW